MADSDYGTPFNNSLSEERKRKLRNEIEKNVAKISGMHNTAIGVCGAYDPAYTCAKINKEACTPSPKFGSESTSNLSTSEKMLDQLAKENKKLTQEKIKLNLKILELQKENYNLTQDKNKYKAFAEAEKDKFWSDLKNGFANITKGIKSIYQKIVNWFNS
jgi:hypothetical protein